MKIENKYEVSIVFITYNASIEKIKKSLVSILQQKDVTFEIVVADDGSRDNHKEEIEEIFLEQKFSDYKLVMNKENHGTVWNYYSGISSTEGEYIKGISPGDYLHDEHVLRNWVDYLKLCNAEWSFSEAIYYDDQSGNPVSVYAHPQNLSPYIKNKANDERWNYLVLNDVALGATMLSTAKIQREYVQRILEKGVKYAEDNIWRLIMFDGIIPAYYKHPTIYYEYGSGISTYISDEWSKRLSRDWKLTDKIMKETENPDKFQQSILDNFRETRNLLRGLFTRGKLVYRIRRRIKPRMTPIS